VYHSFKENERYVWLVIQYSIFLDALLPVAE